MPFVLIGCECSGIIREAFLSAGWDAQSCDLQPSDTPSPNHIQADIISTLEQISYADLIIIHPPCTYLSSSGLHWNKRDVSRANKTLSAIEFAVRLYRLSCEKSEHVAMENPIGRLSTAFRKPNQIIQPYEYGEDASKSTCLWLHNLPNLKPTKYISPRWVNGSPRWGNQTDSGQNKLGPSKNRAKIRSTTYLGIANAMVDQWGGFINREITK